MYVQSNMQTLTYQQLKKKYAEIEGMIPAWFTAAVFRKLVKILTDPDKGKLHACKFLVELNKENGHEERYGLTWAKSCICDEIVKPVENDSELTKLQKEIERLAILHGYPNVKLSGATYYSILKQAHDKVFS